jgi:phosphohistidine phosphatase
MQVYILRHGIAEERRPGRADARRALTPKGRERLSQVLDLARRAGVKPSLILTSPYVRAAQTAEMASQILKCKNVVRAEALLPGSSPEAVWEEARSRPAEKAILLAGHEPLLSQTAGFLLGSAQPAVELKKGALASIEVEAFGPQPRGVLKWLLTPKLADAAANPELE